MAKCNQLTPLPCKGLMHCVVFFIFTGQCSVLLQPHCHVLANIVITDLSRGAVKLLATLPFTQSEQRLIDNRLID